jgi:hypothetical protein
MTHQHMAGKRVERVASDHLILTRLLQDPAVQAASQVEIGDYRDYPAAPGIWCCNGFAAHQPASHDQRAVRYDCRVLRPPQPYSTTGRPTFGERPFKSEDPYTRTRPYREVDKRVCVITGTTGRSLVPRLGPFAYATGGREYHESTCALSSGGCKVGGTM